MIKGDKGRGKVTLENGVKYYVSYKPIASADGWSIAVLIPEAKFTSPLYNTFFITIIVSLIALVLATLGYTYYSRKIANPIIDVVERIEGLESGDLKTSVKVSDYTSETNTLSVSLSNTINILSEYVN